MISTCPPSQNSALRAFTFHLNPKTVMFSLVNGKQVSLFFCFFLTVESSSSTRFVKVRFDNKAGMQVKIIPSKGQNKNEGYTVQPHMTLDLNFEEKGQQNDIPIEFKVDNPWSTGDKLLMNGQQGSVTVVPSPNKDDIKLVTITAACECFSLLVG